MLGTASENKRNMPEDLVAYPDAYKRNEADDAVAYLDAYK